MLDYQKIIIEDAKYTNKRLNKIDFKLRKLNKLISFSNAYFDFMDSLVKENTKTIEDIKLFRNFITKIKCFQFCLNYALKREKE